MQFDWPLCFLQGLAIAYLAQLRKPPPPLIKQALTHALDQSRQPIWPRRPASRNSAGGPQFALESDSLLAQRFRTFRLGKA
jgi:hypothetical protein